MSTQFSRQEIERIINSLEYKRRAIEDYPIGPLGYPSYEFKLSQQKQVNDDLEKCRALRSKLSKGK